MEKIRYELSDAKQKLTSDFIFLYFLSCERSETPAGGFSLNLCVNGRKSMEIRPSERTERKLSSDSFALYFLHVFGLMEKYNGLDARETYRLILLKRNDWEIQWTWPNQI